MAASRSDLQIKAAAFRIVVAEYPKSGGTWLVGLLGDALRWPKRDIYIGDDYRAFEVAQHPWYAGAPGPGLTDTCVVKSHEAPGSPLIDFPARFVHLIRDGRDVAVSKYFFERDFCVANGIYESFDTPFDDYVIKVAAEWRDFILAWARASVVLCRYEELLSWPCASLHEVLRSLGLDASADSILYAVQANSKERMKQALDRTFVSNTFIRKAVAGDWRNTLNEHHKELFKQIAGDALIQSGYEMDLNW